MSAFEMAGRSYLVVQAGPGEGRSFLLDPSSLGENRISVGRSGECAIHITDQRASRHHADLYWNGSHWEIADQRSTNGTYVNGVQLQRPRGLQPGDRVTIGETTLVLRAGIAAAGPQVAQAVRPSVRAERLLPPLPHGGVRPRGGPRVGPATFGVSVARWLMVAIVAAAAIALAGGSLLPWLRVSGSLDEDVSPLFEGLVGVVSSFLGQDSMFNFTQDISGLEGFGKLTLGIALVCMVVLVIDVLTVRTSVIPGIVYLLSGLIAAGSMASDLLNVYQLYKRAESLSLLFGIRLGEVIQFLDRFVEVQVTPLPGLLLTTIGLVLLIVGGIGRSAVALVGPRRQLADQVSANPF